MPTKIESFQHSNLEESEMGQIHALHLNENAIAAVRQRMGTGPGLEECEECGDNIPEARRLAVAGCRHCIHCKTLQERK